jgi:hypothetical protein
MRRLKRDDAPVFVSDGGLTMVGGEFGDTYSLRRKKGVVRGGTNLKKIRTGIELTEEG